MKWFNGCRMRLVLIGIVFNGFWVMTSVCSSVEYIWTQKADMPTPRWLHTSAAVNGKIYVIGGESSEPGTEIISTVEEYDQATDTWTQKADMPTPRRSPATCAVDGKIYVVGGYVGTKFISAVEEYDPATDTWTHKTDMPIPRDSLATCAVDGKVYVIGGIHGDAIVGSNIVEQYDPMTDTWTRKADMPTGVWGLCACVVDGKIYALGGRPGLTATSNVQEYDPTTDTWAEIADMPVATSQMGSVVLGNKIIVIGGWYWSNNLPYTTVQMYDPETDIWTREGYTPFLRSNFSANVVNNRIYAIGGTDRPHPCPATSTVYELTINPPPPDLNCDEIIDSKDVCIMVEYWGTDEPLCDIAPPPFGDGIVNVQDLIFLAEHLFEDYRMIAYWKLDEIDGDIAYDDAGNYDGDLNGSPIWQPAGGLYDGALKFDGNDDYISTAFVLNPGKESFSVFAWIQGGAPGQVIISQSNTAGARGPIPGCTWLGTHPSDGRLMTGFSDVYFGTLESESIITDFQWHHVGFVYDMDTFHRQLYVDGILVAEDATAVSGMPSDGGLYIGASKDLDSTSLFSGFIDDVRIYNQALSVEEIAALAQ